MSVRRQSRRRLALGTALGAAVAVVATTLLVASPDVSAASRSFSLFPAAKTLACLAAPGRTATATATVVSSGQNQTMNVKVSGIRPGLDFDLFTVQNSPFTAAGQPDPRFTGSFDPEIFGFDASTGLPPTHTFHVGFWFNDPAAAAACGFIGATPFNGEQHAGPVAMITRPKANGRGPLG